ncbi:unnamed protein product [Closterium sp. NIES-54]
MGAHLLSPHPLVLETHWSPPCQARIGSLLGKHGVIIQSIRDSTGARLKLADPIPGTDERVIIISARSDKNFRSGDSATEGDGAADRPDDWSVAQEALIRVHARIADADGDNREFRDKDGAEGGASNGAANSGGTPARLLVPSSQIGCLLGKGGSIIAGMRQDSGAHIRIFNKDKLPPCALPTDELVQVTGEYPVVQKALELISIRLRRSPPRDPPNFLAMHPTSGYHQPAGYQPAPAYQASGYHRGADSYPSRSAPAAAFPPQHPPQGYSPYAVPQGYAPTSSPFGGAWGMGAGAAAGGAHGYGGMGGGGRGGGGAGEGAAVEMELRVLCPADRVGIVIGKGGSRIKQIKEETGARVKVTEAVADCDERIVIIDAMEAPFSAHSPTEEALFRVHAAISQHHAGDRSAGTAEEGGIDSHGVTARLLVRKGQVGCVMGKGGSIISELRSTSRARINIPPRDQLPKCADESDEVLVVSGEPHCVSHALRLICARIRGRETAVASKGAAAGDARAGAAAGGARAGAAGAGGYAATGRGGAYGYPRSSSRGESAYGYSPAAAAPAVVATLSAAGPDGTVGWSYERSFAVPVSFRLHLLLQVLLAAFVTSSTGYFTGEYLPSSPSLPPSSPSLLPFPPSSFISLVPSHVLSSLTPSSLSLYAPSLKPSPLPCIPLLSEQPKVEPSYHDSGYSAPRFRFHPDTVGAVRVCTYCAIEFKGGVFRCAQHLAKWKGQKTRDVRMCAKAPSDVRAAMCAHYEKKTSGRDEKRRAGEAVLEGVVGGSKKGRITDFIGDDAKCKKGEADNSVCMFFADYRIPVHHADNPLWRNMVRAINNAGPDYVAPRRNYVGGAGLKLCRTGIEKGLQPIAASWKRDGVTVSSDLMTDRCGRPQANVMLINESGTVFDEAIDCKMESKTGSYIASLLRPIIE